MPEADEEPYYCSCGSSFCSPQSLAAHCEATGHGPEGAEDGYECPMCGALFASEAALRNHCGGALPSGDAEPKWCSCGRGFCSARALASHATATGHPAEDDYEALSRLDENVVQRGLSTSALKRLAERRTIAQTNDEDPITKEPWVIGAVVVPLPCGHVFEETMLWPWFDEHRTCPVCRLELEE